MALRKSSTPPAPAVSAVPRVVPLATNFDFLEGAFDRAEKARRTSLGAAVLSLVVLSALVLLGFAASSQYRSDVTAAATADAADAAAVQQIAQLDQAGGISAARLRAHASARQGGLRTALTGDADVAGLFAAVTASVPPGVKVTQVEFTGAAPAAPAAAPATTGGTTPAPAPAPGTGARSLKVVGTADSFAKIGAWNQALAAIPGLVMGGDPTWSGGGDSLQVTLTATISDAANSSRAKAAVNSDQYGFTKDGS